MKILKRDHTTQISTRFVTANGMDSQIMSPIDIPSVYKDTPRYALSSAIKQIETGLEAYVSPPNVSLVRLKNPFIRSLRSQEIITENSREFYTLGLEYSGKLSSVVCALKIRDLGMYASVTLESKEVMAPAKNLLPWLFSTFYTKKFHGEPEGETEKKNGITTTGVVVCLLVGGAIGGLLEEPGAGFTAALVLACTVYGISESLNKRKQREVAELIRVAQLSVVRAYDMLDFSTVSPAHFEEQTVPLTITQNIRPGATAASEQPDRLD